MTTLLFFRQDAVRPRLGSRLCGRFRSGGSAVETQPEPGVRIPPARNTRLFFGYD